MQAGDIFYSKVIKALMPLSMVTGNKAWRYYKRLSEREFLSETQIQRAQWEKLKEIIEYAYRNVPFYSDIFNKQRIRPAQIKSFSDLRRVPVTTKEDVRRNFPGRIVSDLYQRGTLRFSNTSGSSGRHLMFADDTESVNYKYASKLRSRKLMGKEAEGKVFRFTPNENRSCLMTGGNPQLTLNNFFQKLFKDKKNRKQIYYTFLEHNLVNSFIHRRKFMKPLPKKWAWRDLKVVFEEIEAHKPKILAMNPVYAYLLAGQIERSGKKFSFADGAIDLTGGLSNQSMRRYMMEKFDFPVYQIYGSSEFGRIASQCRSSKGAMHVLEEMFFVEILNGKGEPVKAGEPGDIVVTSLTNHALPFIRYKIGDRGFFKEGRCSCGRKTKMIDITGRNSGCIRLKDGRIIEECFFYDLLLNKHGILLFRLVQEEVGSFRLKIVESKNGSFNQKIVRRKLLKELGPAAKIKIEKVSHIPPEPSGKYLLVKSETE